MFPCLCSWTYFSISFWAKNWKSSVLFSSTLKELCQFPGSIADGRTRLKHQLLVFLFLLHLSCSSCRHQRQCWIWKLSKLPLNVGKEDIIYILFKRFYKFLRQNLNKGCSIKNFGINPCGVVRKRNQYTITWDISQFFFTALDGRHFKCVAKYLWRNFRTLELAKNSSASDRCWSWSCSAFLCTLVSITKVDT